jgi:hypothetical protein
MMKTAGLMVTIRHVEAMHRPNGDEPSRGGPRADAYPKNAGDRPRTQIEAIGQ